MGKNLFFGKLKEFFLSDVEKNNRKVSNEELLSILNDNDNDNGIDFINRKPNLFNALVNYGIPEEKVSEAYKNEFVGLCELADDIVSSIKRSKALALGSANNEFRRFGIDISGENFTEFELNELSNKISKSKMSLCKDPELVRQIEAEEAAYDSTEVGAKEKLLVDAYNNVSSYYKPSFVAYEKFRISQTKEEKDEMNRELMELERYYKHERIAKYFRDKGVPVPENYRELKIDELRVSGGLRTEKEEENNSIVLSLRASGIDLSKIEEKSQIGKAMFPISYLKSLEVNMKFLADSLLEDAREQRKKVEANRKPS